MKIPTITQVVRPHHQAQFTHYVDGNLWYEVSYETDDIRLDVCGEAFNRPAIFSFPVPINDTSGGTFLRSDKASIFMRWIRKHIEFLKNSVEQARNDDGA